MTSSLIALGIHIQVALVVSSLIACSIVGHALFVNPPVKN